MNNRRSFLKQSLATIGATVAGSSLAKADTLFAADSKISLKKGDIILFQGDSITDHGRNREAKVANDINALGRGYAMVAASNLLNKYASKDLKIYNRGISGHKVPQLDARWQEDCLDLKPNVLSILIGVNDYWHKRNGNYQGSAQEYKEQYRRLLDKTLKALPEVKLIIGEPFAVKNVKHVDDSWFPEFAAYQAASKEVAKEYKALFIPYQTVFDKALKVNSGAYWTTDGVHTSLAGVNLMASCYTDLFK